MAKYHVSVYVDDDGTGDAKCWDDADERVDIYLVVGGVPYSLHVDDEGVWWDDGRFGGNGDPTRAEG